MTSTVTIEIPVGSEALLRQVLALHEEMNALALSAPDGSKSSNMILLPKPVSDTTRYVLCYMVLLAILTGAVLFVEYGSDLGLLPDRWRPGIGDVVLARSKIETGMTRGEVKSVLGRPHVDLGDEWEYWNGRILAGAVLLIHFGGDDRVTSTESWLR